MRKIETKVNLLDKAISQIYEFKLLKENWDNLGAQSINDKVISNALRIIKNLKQIPDIFPTGRNSIQFEYELPNGDYFELEIFENKTLYYISNQSIEEEGELSDSLNLTYLEFKFYDYSNHPE